FLQARLDRAQKSHGWPSELSSSSVGQSAGKSPPGAPTRLLVILLPAPHSAENRRTPMARILFIGGTGQISLPCVELALADGHEVAIFNRGQRDEALPAGVESIIGDMKDPGSYRQLGQRDWDVVAQFMVFTPEQMQQD